MMSRTTLTSAVLGVVAVLSSSGAALAGPTADTRSAVRSERSAAGGSFPDTIALPTGFQPEGITIGRQPYAYLGSLADGSIYRANLVTGRGQIISQGPGTSSVGMKLDSRGLLFVAGGAAGDARVVDNMGNMGSFKSFLAKLSPLVLSIMRIVAAFLFMEHGLQKLFGIPVPMQGGTVALFSLVGLTGVIEFFGGLFVFLGLFTRQAAFIMSGEMAFAYFMRHAPSGFWPILNQGELAALYCFVFLYLSFAGGGPISLDRILHKKD